MHKSTNTNKNYIWSHLSLYIRIRICFSNNYEEFVCMTRQITSVHLAANIQLLPSTTTGVRTGHTMSTQCYIMYTQSSGCMVHPSVHVRNVERQQFRLGDTFVIIQLFTYMYISCILALYYLPTKPPNDTLSALLGHEVKVSSLITAC